MSTIEIDAKRDLSFDPADRDTAIAPGDDFYHYAVGSWLKNHPIPDDHSRWGVFELLTEYTNNIVKHILEDPMPFTGTPDEPLARKVSDLYALGLDEERLECEGLLPLQVLLDEINALSTANEMARLVGKLHRTLSRPCFLFFATPDAKQSDTVIGGLVQGGLGLPERDYYLALDERSVDIRAKYVEHTARLLVLGGSSAAEARVAAEKIMQLETALATHMLPKEELRDPVKNYHKMPYADVQKLYPRFNWQIFFNELGLPNPGPIDVGQPDFFAGFNDLMGKIKLDDWKWYLRTNVLRSAAEYVSAAFEEEKFNFYGKVFSGLKQMKPRSKRVVETVDNWMGKAVGKLYVKDNFSSIAKERAHSLVENIRLAMEGRIKRLEWMGEATKVEALKKLHTITVKVGYPDKWYDYTPLVIDKNFSYVENIRRCYAFEMRRELDKIGKPVDRTEWLMDPQTVNAYYEPSKNEIVFPAGILQPPFFNDAVDDAMNYGGIGAVIGHEITHGFDDQGRQFDAYGNLRDWWTKEDEIRFKERAKGLVEQYNGFELLPGLLVNGEFTQGENIADLGGVEVAYDAFKLTDESKTKELIDGCTPDERFFLSYAQTWKTNVREEKARLYIKVDPHAPGIFRVNGSVSNVAAFYTIFKVLLHHKLYRPPEKRVKIW
ncbi:MAG: hypothetical protein A3I29_04905 [Candidatus Magasanikbacteria bacterium RIFCSPLOWO2_02_FULL_44_11]|uniref:Peptidase M13 n=1 Tax=Candidatus Magasanikbacteria bacterium RIFCSPLOWO2_02_FULL_44_11 TaxID=1798689 RepID=A0A1F6NA34_9BACT|nr:MAG: hypothetical protein A3I29_04905 [Candidatus Magasanikbacteria bacterium RIFCSPLOWO2_02_FULL_44_11]